MRKRWLLVLGSIFLVMLGINTWAARGTGGVRVKKTTAKAVINPIDLYKESHALLIGASAYNNGWPKLRGVLDDVPAVRAALEKQGFTVTTVMDPDHVALPKAFDDFIYKHGRDVNNRLLFYFAGHGHTDKKSWGEEMGYIVPVDAPSPEVDLDGFVRFGLDMQQIEVYAKRINSKHALFVFDSCFSGSIFALSRAIPASINYKTASPVRQFITSGSAEESVPDRSDFRVQFESALAGEADSNKDGYITGTELGVFLQDTVINYSRDSQHPQYGTIRNPKLDKGDFVFQVAETESQQPLNPVTSLPLPSSRSKFSLADLKTEDQEQQDRVNKSTWDTWQVDMQSAFDEAAAFAGSAASRRKAWGRFLTTYAENNTYSAEDERLRKEAKRKQAAVRDEPVVVDVPPPVVVSELLPYEPETVAIPAGSFAMGSTVYDSEQPVHTVHIKAFQMGKYEVTNAQFRKFRPEHNSGEYSGHSLNGDNQPVVRVSWADAVAYTEWLAKETGKPYRLPSEAEWEYAARAGTSTKYYWGNEIDPTKLNFSDKNDPSGPASKDLDDGYAVSAPVGSYPENPWHLYDMSGNVWEWNQDKWHDSYKGAPTDGSAWESGDSSSRRPRGCSWDSIPDRCRAAYRSLNTNPYYCRGFRVVFGVAWRAF